MSDLTSTSPSATDAVPDAQPSATTEAAGAGARRFRPLIGRRTAAGISVAGLVAAAILTSVASSAPASAAAGSPGLPSGQTTVSQTTSSSAGTMTIQVMDHRGRHGLKVASVTYSVSSAAAIKSPTLTFVFSPSGPLLVPPVPPRKLHRVPPRKLHRVLPRKLPLRVLVFTVNLKGPQTSFSGALPAKEIAALNQHGGLPGGYTLTVNLGSIIKKTKRGIAARILMQEGLVLNPVGIFVKLVHR